QRLGDPGELFLREDEQAAFLPFGDHHAPSELVPVLRGQDQPALLVKPGGVSTEEHRCSPPTPILHCAPLYPTFPHGQRLKRRYRSLVPTEGAGRRGGAGWREREGPGGLAMGGLDEPRRRRRR